MKTREEVEAIIRKSEKEGRSWEGTAFGVIIALLLDIRDLITKK